MAYGDFVSQQSQGFQQIGTEGGVRPFNPLQGMPGMSGPVGQMLAPLLLPFLNQHAAAHGSLLYGNTNQNMVDHLRSMEMTRMMQALRESSAAAERENFMRTGEALWKAANPKKPWDDAAKASVGSMADLAVSAMPAVVAAGGGQFMDAVTGGASATMLQLGSQAGMTHRLDAASGRHGLGLESAKALQDHLMRAYFKHTVKDKAGNDVEEFDPNWKERSKGFTSYEIGGAYSDMMSRGMIATTERTPQNTARLLGSLDNKSLGKVLDAVLDEDAAKFHKSDGSIDASKLQELTADELKKITDNPILDTHMRALDATKSKQGIDKYLGALRGMQDIFGEIFGRNGTPSELMNALETFSGGTVAQLKPGRIEQLVRMSHQSAKTAGMSMDEFLMMQQGFQQSAQKMGLDPVFGVLAAQHAANSLTAFRDLGIGATQHWGKLNANQHAQASGQLMLHAQASAVGNVFAVATHIKNTIGAENIRPGTELAAVMTAIESGASSYVDPVTKKTEWLGDMTSGKLGTIAQRDTGGKVTSAGVSAAYNNTHGMQGIMAEQGAALSVRNMQGEEDRRKISVPAVEQALRSRGFTDQEGIKRISAVTTEAGQTMSQAEFDDDKTRLRLKQEAMLRDESEGGAGKATRAGLAEQDRITREKIAKGEEGMTTADLNLDARGNLTATGKAKLDAMIVQSEDLENTEMYRRHGHSTHANKQLNDRHHLAVTAQRSAENQARALAADATGGLQVGSDASEFVTALQSGDDIPAAVAKALGVVKTDKLKADLAKPLDKLAKAKADLEAHINTNVKPITDKMAANAEDRRKYLAEHAKAMADETLTPEKKKALEKERLDKIKQFDDREAALTKENEKVAGDTDLKKKAVTTVGDEMRDIAAGYGVSDVAKPGAEGARAADRTTAAVKETTAAVKDLGKDKAAAPDKAPPAAPDAAAPADQAAGETAMKEPETWWDYGKRKLGAAAGAVAGAAFGTGAVKKDPVPPAPAGGGSKQTIEITGKLKISQDGQDAAIVGTGKSAKQAATP